MVYVGMMFTYLDTIWLDGNEATALSVFRFFSKLSCIDCEVGLDRRLFGGRHLCLFLFSKSSIDDGEVRSVFCV